MGITFDSIPTANRVPTAMVEIDGKNALTSPSKAPHRVLLLGIRLSSGSAAALAIKPIYGELDGDAYFGSKSHLAEMCRAYKRINKTALVYAMGVNEDGAGVAAHGTFPITGTATEDGTLKVRIGDKRIKVAVTSGDANTAVATALNTAINTAERLMWSSSVSTGTCTVTCRHKGLIGNGITFEVESIPAGLDCTPVNPASGATNPDLTSAIAAFDDVRYDRFVTGLSDDGNMDLLEAEAERRWGPDVKQPGLVVGGVCGTLGTLTTAGQARNSAYSCLVPSGLSPTPAWVFAAQAAARDGQRCESKQPNRPRNGMKLNDCEAPAVGSRLDQPDRNTLLYSGVSTFKVTATGDVFIERLITTYQTNTNGLTDTTYLSIETMSNLASMYTEMLQIADKYGDYDLAPDGTKVDPGIAVLTPAGYKGELIAWYDQKIKQGRAKDAAGFAEDLVVEIDADDPERLNTHVAPRLVNANVTMAHKISFKL